MCGSKRPNGRYAIQYPLSRFLNTIRKLETPATTREIAEAVGCSFDTASAKLTQLEEIGAVSRTRETGTTYWMNDSGPKEVTAKDINIFCTHIYEAASSLWDSVDSKLISDIGSSIRELIENHGFDQVNQPLRVSSELAAFSFTLKCTTYLDYQASDDELSPLETAPEEIFRQFESAADETGNPAFDTNPLDFLVESAPENAVQPLIHIAYRLRNAEKPIAVIGEMYEQVIPKSGREKRGQFRTPRKIADILSEWAIEDGGEMVLDPGSGAGVLSAAAYKSKIRRKASTGISDIWSIDISSLSVLMTATALQLSNGGSLPNIHESDFMHVQPKHKTGKRWFSNPDVRLPTVDAVFANPPYTRSKEIDNSEELRQLMMEETGKEFDPKTPLYQYFLVHASQFLNDTGRMAIIASSSFLDAKYGTEFQEDLLSEFRIHGVVQLGSEIEVFDADVSTVLLFLTKSDEKIPPDAETTIVRLQSWPGQEAVLDLVGGTHQVEVTGEYEFVDQDELEPGHNWISSIGWNPNPLLDTLPDFESISDISRGVATGKNEFFCLDSGDIDEWGLSDDFCQPILKRPHHAPHYTFNRDDRQELIDSNEEAWMLDCRRDGSPITDVESSNLVAYLDYGEKIGADDTVLASRRSQWYTPPSRESADIVVPYMNRGRVRFIANHTDTITLNNLHAVYLNDYTPAEQKALLAYLNSNTASEVAIKMGRSYNRGLNKLELSDLRSLPVLDPDLLDEEQKSDLAEAFESLERTSRGQDSLKEAEILAKIDALVAEILQGLHE
jgi:methylase of polypeptide subunit release factors/predicted transcriptional regulator